MHGFAHRIVTTEAERYIGETAAGAGAWAAFFDFLHRFDEIDGVVVVLLHAGGDGEHVKIENDVLRIHAHLFGEDLVGALGDGDLVVARRSLALFVESHDDGRRTIAHDLFGLCAELVFTALEADGIDDALTLHALEACFDDRPLGAVDHDRHLANVWLGGDEVEEAGHAGFAVEHAFVEIDIDNLRAFLDLREHDGEGAGEVVVLNQLLKAR